MLESVPGANWAVSVTISGRILFSFHREVSESLLPLLPLLPLIVVIVAGVVGRPIGRWWSLTAAVLISSQATSQRSMTKIWRCPLNFDSS